MRIIVGIGPRLLESADDGRTWTEGTRVVPPPTAPRVIGARAGLAPPAPTGWTISDIHVGADGLGFAAGSEPSHGKGQRDSTARFLRTRDAGDTWERIDPDIGFWGRFRAGASWPPEEVDSIAVRSGGLLAFTWEDPWLYEGPHCHIALSADAGSSWRYARLPDGCTWLVLEPGALRVSGGGVARWSGSKFQRESFQLDWMLPPGYWDAPVPVRLVRFTSEMDGLGLTVSWIRDAARQPDSHQPPLVGLARTRDGGRLWTVQNTWEGPLATDLNERYQVDLDVV